MTVESATASASYNGNGSTVVFAVPFYFLVDTDIKISKLTGATGVVSTLVLDSDYTLTGAGNTAGGSATLAVAPLTGDELYIERNVSAVQETAYPSNSPFPAASHERALDRLTMLAQQILAKLTFGLFRDPLTSAYEAGGNVISNIGDGVADTDAVSKLQMETAVAAAAGGVLPDAIALAPDLASTATGKGAALIGWIASGAGAIARTVLAKLRERPSVVDFGADPTGVADSTLAFNAALAAYSHVYVPPGTYKLTDAVSVASGKRLYGASRRATILAMDATFNASALGCLVFTGGEPGPTVEHLRISQTQPDSTTATVYPPCIYAQDTPRFTLRSLRLGAVYVGIDMKGNSGGAVIDDLEISPLSVGIDIDGCLDSVKISKLHLWPFSLSSNQRVSYTAAYGIKSGRCDDFHLSDSLLFSMVNACSFYNGTSGRTFGNLINVDFDDRGGLNLSAGDLSLSACVFTQGKNDARLLYMTGGSLNVGASRFRGDVINTSANGFIEIDAGDASFVGCRFDGLQNDKNFIYVTNATANIAGSRFKRSPDTAYTTAFVRAATNTKGALVGNSCTDLGTGSSKMVQVDNDYGLVVRGNVANGWTVQVPSGALTNTLVQGNLGVGSNKDEFCGYFSSDASTSVKLPSGWSLSKPSTGNYALTHNLGLSALDDVMFSLTCDFTAIGAVAQVDRANSSVNVVRIRTYVGTTATDCGVFVNVRRYRS